MRAFNVLQDRKRVYFISDDSERSAFWAWDIAGGVTQRLCLLAELDSRLGLPAYWTHGGNGSWDKLGRIYFCAFGNDSTHPTELLLCQLNPERLRRLQTPATSAA